ncbi:hypothetical protein ACWGI0_25620 [Streptomyces sp. NPDC054802]
MKRIPTWLLTRPTVAVVAAAGVAGVLTATPADTPPPARAISASTS